MGRVILNAVLNGSNSDYINASSVTDHDPRNPSYIVTQGPLAQTVADFWQMIWEQGCVVIVMLSRLQDNYTNYAIDTGLKKDLNNIIFLRYIWLVNMCGVMIIWFDLYTLKIQEQVKLELSPNFISAWPAQSVPSSTKALLE